MKQKIFELIDEKGKNKNPWNRTFDIFIVALIIASIIEVILESYEQIHLRFIFEFRLFEIVTVIVFTIEYIFRVWTADLKFPDLTPFQARTKFMFSFMGLVDLIAIMPFYLPFIFAFDLRFIRILRVVRLLRIFKLNRYTRALQLVGNVFYEKRNEMGITLFVTFILLLLSSSLMYNFEHDEQPDKFPDIISTLWWAVATLTTVGYGDVYPITGLGKLISGIIALLGIGLVALPTGIISAGFFEKIESEKEEKKTKLKYKYCPHCGMPVQKE